MIQMLKSKLTHQPKIKGQSWTDYYGANEVLFGTLIFVGGFVFDVFTVSDMDDRFSLIQQSVYLVLVGLFIYFETLEKLKAWAVPRWLEKIWVIREIGMHFFLGSLLSVYSLFFFKSASLATGFVFILVMALLMVANEFPQLQKRGPLVRWMLWTLCLMSFFQILMPIALTYVGWLPFMLAWILTALVLLGVFYLITKGLREFLKETQSLLWPSGAALVLFFVLYLFKMVPPVPIVLKDIGIYHRVEKVGDEYIKTEEREWWKFWHRGDQDFRAKPGDLIYAYFAISSPGRIQDQIQLRWMYKDPRAGWQSADTQAIQIRGGRGDGYRGFAYKKNYQEGQWRIQVETTDAREIGRLSFWVTKVAPTNAAPALAPSVTPPPPDLPAPPTQISEPPAEAPEPEAPAEMDPVPPNPEMPEGEE